MEGLKTFSAHLTGRRTDVLVRSGESFLRAAVRSGLHAWARLQRTGRGGGRALLRMAVSAQKRAVLPEPPDIVVSLDDAEPGRGTRPGSALVYDSDKAEAFPASWSSKVKRLGLPLGRLTDVPMLGPVAAAGALAQVAGFRAEDYCSVWKGGDAAEAARSGYDYAAANFPDLGLAQPRLEASRVVFGGCEAAAAAAAASGCRFFASTRSKGATFEWLAPRAADMGIVCVSARDGNSAAHMVLGAGYAGVRSMAEIPAEDIPAVCEAIGWAARAEVPAVLLHPGDATGEILNLLAAEVQQAPRIVLGPASISELYASVAQGFELSETYQCPVCVAADKQLLDRWESFEVPEMPETLERGVWAAPSGEPYDRYRPTDTGVSPRSVPGQEGLLHTAVPPPRGEEGERRRAKLARKHLAILSALRGGLSLHGPADADLTVIARGGISAALPWVLDKVNAVGERKANLLAVRQLLPFPAGSVAKVVSGSKRAVTVESDADGPLRWLMRREAGIDLKGLRMTVPMRAQKAFDELREELYRG